DRNEIPAERGFTFAPEDRRLSALFRNLHGMEADRARYREIYGVDLVEEHAPIWQALVERGWAVVDDDRISLVGDGVFYTPMIQTYLGSSRAEELKRSLVSKSLQLAR